MRWPAFVALTALVPAWIACSPLGSGLAPGTAVRASDADQPPATGDATEGWEAALQLPDGRLTVQVTLTEQDRVAARDTFDEEELSVDEGRLARVSWTLDSGAGLPLAARRLVLSPDIDAGLWLVDGDERTRLDVEGLGHSRGAVWTAVDDIAEVSLEVEFDGTTLTVDHDGTVAGDPPSEPLLDPGAGRDGSFQDCDRVLDPASDPAGDLVGDPATCRAALASWPWLPGLGWSAGGPWRLVRLETSEPEADTTLGGLEPVASMVVTDDVPTPSSILVFAPGTGS